MSMSWVGYVFLCIISIGLIMVYIKLTDIELEIQCFRRRFDIIVDTLIDALKNKED